MKKCVAQRRKGKTKMHENDISRIIVDTAFRIHRSLEPGLLELAYEKVLKVDLERRGLKVLRQVTVPIEYDGLASVGSYSWGGKRNSPQSHREHREKKTQRKEKREKENSRPLLSLLLSFLGVVFSLCSLRLCGEFLLSDFGYLAALFCVWASFLK
jgi:hypothetical protein